MFRPESDCVRPVYVPYMFYTAMCLSRVGLTQISRLSFALRSINVPRYPYNFLSFLNSWQRSWWSTLTLFKFLYMRGWMIWPWLLQYKEKLSYSCQNTLCLKNIYSENTKRAFGAKPLSSLTKSLTIFLNIKTCTLRSDYLSSVARISHTYISTSFIPTSSYIYI